MKPYYDSPEGQIYHGHTPDILRSMPSESVQMCVTSPPYWGLRDYGLPPMVWDAQEGCAHVWGDELPETNKRNTRPSGDHPKDCECNHCKAEYRPKTSGQFCQTCNAWRGCLGLEPTLELYIKHMVQIFSEVKRVLRNDGTLWLNVGDSYNSGTQFNHHSSGFGDANRYSEGSGRGDWPGHRKLVSTMKTKDLCGIPWMLAFALRADGWYLRSDIIWHKPNPMPESVTDRPTKSHEYIFLLTKSAKYFYDADAIREPQDSTDRSKFYNPADMPTRAETSLKISRFASSRQRNEKGVFTDQGKDSKNPKGGYQEQLRQKRQPRLLNPAGRNKRTVWTIPTQPMPQAHFATFPEKLIEPCILAGTSAKGCCVECGAPWERIIEKTGPDRRNVKSDYPHKQTIATLKYKHDSDGPTSKTIGWQPTCKCGRRKETTYIDGDFVGISNKSCPMETEPCIVLDPFGGAMTTAIVAHKHGRKFVIIELSKTYIDEIGIPRIKKATEQLKLF